MILGFTKMHGLGNDFVVMDNFNGRITLTPEQVSFLCDRHKGIGADGIILVESREGADCFMNYINADGTKAEMCGNGVRCVAKFLKDNYLKDKTNFLVDTLSGIKEITSHDDDTYSVDMGKASFSHTDFPEESMSIEGLDLAFVSMGNPFAIAMVEDLNSHDFLKLGKMVENNKIFPNRINFELVENKGENKYKVRVWERGCGETLACGTGACAVFALLAKNAESPEEIRIEFPGGTLHISSDSEGGITMRGLAEEVFSGTIEIY